MAETDPNDPYADDPYVLWARAQQLGSTMGPRGRDVVPPPVPPLAPPLPPQPAPPLAAPLAPPVEPARPQRGLPDRDTGRQRIGEAGGEETASSRDALMPLPSSPAIDPYAAAMGAAGGALPGFRVDVPQTPPPTSPTQTDPYFAAMQAGGAVVSPTQLPAPQGPATSPGAAPLTDEQRDQILARVSPEDRLRFTKELTPEQRAAEIEKMSPAERAQAVSAMSPEEFLRFKANYQSKLIAEEARRRAEIETENLKREQDAFFARQQAFARAQEDTKTLLADAQQLANTKIDPERFGKNLGTGGSIMALVATTLGGAMSQYTGGKNLALDAYQKRIDNDIEAQKLDIANGWRGIETRKGAIAAEFERHGEMYRAQETYRVAAYQTAINQLQTHLQQFDPNGATAMRTRETIDAFHAQVAQQLQAYQQQQFTNRIAQAKAEREAFEANEKARHDRAEEGVAWLHAQLAKDNAKKANQVLSIDQIRSAYGKDVADTLAAQGVTGATGAQIEKSLAFNEKKIEAGQKAEDRTEKKADKAQKAQVLVPVALSATGQPHYEPLKQENGTPYQIPEGMEKDTHEKLAAYTRLVTEIDAMRMLRAQNGGHVGPGIESRKMAQHQAKAIIASMEAAGFKRLTDSDISIMKDISTGGKDPDAAIASLSENLLEFRNMALSDRKTILPNFTGKLPDVPDPVAAYELAQKNLNKPSVGETVPWTDPNSAWQQGHANRARSGLSDDLANQPGDENYTIPNQPTWGWQIPEKP